MQSLKTKVCSLFIIWSLFFTFFNSKEEQPTKKEFPKHLIGAFTGGFGEKTCQSCHFDYDLNGNEGSLELTGLPKELTPGSSYPIKIVVFREDLGKAGFQISARDRSGKQAGLFSISNNERVMFTKQVPDSLQYVQHSSLGTEPIGAGVNNWTIEWTAPEKLTETILFNVASNAANGDESAFGDWIYTKEVVIKSPREN